MADMLEGIKNLEENLNKMFLTITTLETTVKTLKQDLATSEIKLSDQQDEVKMLKTKYDAIKSANSFLGSEENKKETKLKINSLIREIDYCIAQISD